MKIATVLQGRRVFPWKTAGGLLLLSAAAWYCRPLQAQELGTLFTTPEEREYLDYLRDEFLANSQDSNFNILETVVPDIPVAEEEQEVEEAPEILEYKLGGIMTSRDGGRKVWLNGARIAEKDLPANMRLVDTAGGLALDISKNGTDYLIKPGQEINITDGDISESSRETPQQTGASSPVVRDQAEATDETPRAQTDQENPAAAASVEPAATLATTTEESSAATTAKSPDFDLEANAPPQLDLDDPEIAEFINSLIQSRDDP